MHLYYIRVIQKIKNDVFELISVDIMELHCLDDSWQIFMALLIYDGVNA